MKSFFFFLVSSAGEGFFVCLFVCFCFVFFVLFFCFFVFFYAPPLDIKWCAPRLFFLFHELSHDFMFIHDLKEESELANFSKLDGAALVGSGS